MAQTVRHISTHKTAGELSALLLESRMIKELQPIHNRRLRRLTTLTAARHRLNAAGYATVSLVEAEADMALDRSDTLATYPRKSQAKRSLEEVLRRYQLCPKLLGLEKAPAACFWYQLGKCGGACCGKEPAAAYNARLQSAFASRRVREWPYAGPVLVQETEQAGIVVDDWCVLAEVTQEDDCAPRIVSRGRSFDLDTYKILQTFMSHKTDGLRIRQLEEPQLGQLGLV